MPEEERASKKLWDRTAWKEAGFFLAYLRPHSLVFIPALIALAITGGLTIWFIKELAALAGKGIGGASGPEWMAEVNDTVWFLVVIVSVQAFIAFWRILLFAKASERALAALRLDTFSRIIRLPMATLNQRRVGELASRLANDVEAMRETLVVTIPMLIRHSVMLLLSLILLLQMSVKLSLFMVGTIPVVIVMIAIFGSRIRKLTRRAQDNLAASQVVVDESLQSIVSVKAFRNEAYELTRYDKNLGEYLRTVIKAAVPRASFISFIIFAFSVALILVTWFAMRMLNDGSIGKEELTQFAGLTGMVAASFMAFPELITQLQRALGATERVREILHDETEPAEEASIPVVRCKGAIEMRGVSFAYPTRPEAVVLRDFDLSASAGQRIALVGPSGSGKSTSIALLFRFYEPITGEILIDGIPIREMSLTALRRNLALVPQEVLLFGGSIRENIAYGAPGASEEEIIRAAKQANAHEFITGLTDGYETLVGDRGAQLSGGQRQRIAIARAILADPAILILDEATSSLDAESERLVQDALDKLMENRTSIIIAHRLSTVRRCDQILVMSGGAILERGTHDELIAKEGGLYGSLAKLQLE
ncbi:MAG: ABC transporter transmembrane domain-containing protein [Verrucomicrobiales bacterium]|jgi:ATP-binding cassette, subfamily B, bacterial|nr:ABC transporter transmembrane domain-containing protein [Verrucomicrobiales bacterium]MDP4790997.1 ABC transporter transmembrane domain-containing protein [Verrucomicrobiales bacterium]MDP5005695.1 ABC transporter transmembrane domain-containing protein [Verrucomicrobiales bacterium]